MPLHTLFSFPAPCQCFFQFSYPIFWTFICHGISLSLSFLSQYFVFLTGECLYKISGQVGIMDSLVECRDTIYRRGRYKIRLDIPVTSTLTEREIDRVAAICSWDIDPNKEAAGYEGGRAILIGKENPVRR